ncbi:MAG: D-alanyl-D-alanine carboxypeptidase [Geminicoccus sp.]|nr:D-alanyl-D-alanine carboxypeptidase [Geminicoccus sp.]
MSRIDALTELSFRPVRLERWSGVLRSALAGLFALLALTILAPLAGAITTDAKQAIVVDAETGKVLYEKNARQQMAPSSMTKVMTAYVLFNALRAGQLSMDTIYTVSEKASSRRGSTMWLERRQKVSVQDLLIGLIVVSGNDAAIALGEGFAGTEAEFAKLMNATAVAIGMVDTNFVNASGWPDEGHYSTAWDLAILGQRLISDHPDFYSYFARKSFNFNDILQNNRNPILGDELLGVDGIKTGQTDAGGYGVMISAVRDDRRVIIVLNGATSKAERKTQAERLTDWALRAYGNHSLFRAGQVIGHAPVWLGQQDTVPLVAKYGLRMTLPRHTYENLRAQVTYRSPVPAPVNIGTELGTLILSGPGIDPQEIPVVAGASVDSVGRLERVSTGIRYIVFGLSD